MIWANISPEICRWQLSIWKGAQHLIFLGNCKLKQRRDVYLLEWTKSRIPTPNAGENVEQQELHSLLGRMQRQFGGFLQNWTYSYHMIHQSHGLVFTQRMWSFVATQNLHMMFIATLFVITKTWEQPRYLLLDDWINKLWYIQTAGCYSELKRNKL